MQKIFLWFVVVVASPFSSFAQHQDAREKLREFFFDLHFNLDVEALRTELKSKPLVKLYQDPNRDERKTIIGTIGSDKNLNPLCIDNQIIVSYSSAEAKKTKKVSLKWSMSYRLEDLASTFLDFEKLSSEFKPLFSDVSEQKKTGVQKEKIRSLTLKDKSMIVTITLIEYINFSHLISLEYRDTWRIEKADLPKN